MSALALVGSSACGPHRPDEGSAKARPAIDDQRCAFGAQPTVLKREGTATLKRWEVRDQAVFWQPTLPSDVAFTSYRRAIEKDGGDLRRPVADPPTPASDEERAVWRAEERNLEAAFSGHAGTVRHIYCLEALLFADQNARYSQTTHPTEFISSVLRKETDGQVFLRIYLSGSDQMFPSKSFYGLDDAKVDVGNGWTYVTFLHNHPVQKNRGRLALGAPTLSTSDVDLARGLAESGLQSATVTNGFYTAEIPAAALANYVGRQEITAGARE